MRIKFITSLLVTIFCEYAYRLEYRSESVIEESNSVIELLSSKLESWTSISISLYFSALDSLFILLFTKDISYSGHTVSSSCVVGRVMFNLTLHYSE